jgi:hypothetical protein
MANTERWLATEVGLLQFRHTLSIQWSQDKIQVELQNTTKKKNSANLMDMSHGLLQQDSLSPGSHVCACADVFIARATLENKQNST